MPTKTAVMSASQVMTYLDERGSEGYRKIYAKGGATQPMFGVKLGDVRSLARRLKTQHALALELWDTDNVDAMILATMLMDPAELSEKESERLLKGLTFFRLVDELVFNAVAASPSAEKLRVKWMASKQELTARAGWHLLVKRVMRGLVDGIDLDEVLKSIEKGLLKAPRLKREAMNRALVEIGVKVREKTDACIAIGERLGRWDPTPVPKGCVPTYAPEWIAAVLKRKA